MVCVQRPALNCVVYIDSPSYLCTPQFWYLLGFLLIASQPLDPPLSTHLSPDSSALPLKAVYLFLSWDLGLDIVPSLTALQRRSSFVEGSCPPPLVNSRLPRGAFFADRWMGQLSKQDNTWTFSLYCAQVISIPNNLHSVKQKFYNSEKRKSI